ESLLIQAVRGTHEEIPQMPYKKPPLSGEQIRILAQWIDEGAKAPADEAPEDPKAAARRHWSFRPPERPAPPSVQQMTWTRNAIDRFILAKLEAGKIKPSPEADKTTL